MTPKRKWFVTPLTSEPFSALAFKIMVDPFVGKLAFFRVYSGTLTAGSYVMNSTKQKRERMSRIMHDARQSPRRSGLHLHRRNRRRCGSEGHHHRRHPVR